MRYKTYSNEIIFDVINEINKGESKKYISEKYNISRGTIYYWLKNPNKKTKLINIDDIFININKQSYSYILGVYLGDGYIDKISRTYRLRIALDSRQDLVIKDCIKHLSILFPDNKINFNKVKNTNLCNISIHSNLLPIIFPHLGKGKKHERDIILTEQQILNINSNYLMKGLFHTDGSFYIAINKYPRYQFTNMSKDIINMFNDCLLNVGITAKIIQRKNGIYNILIQNKKNVKILYYILGEKYINKVFDKSLFDNINLSKTLRKTVPSYKS